MLGHKWEAAQGVVVDARTGPQAGHGVAAALRPEHQYLVEVRKPAGEVIRGTVTEKSMRQRQVGDSISVEVHSRTNEMRMDSSASRMDSFRDMMNTVQQMPSGAGPGAVPGSMAGLAGLAGALGAANAGGASIHMTGPDGQQIPVHMQSEEIRDLAQAITSGDPTARRAAIERMRQIKAQAQQQTAYPAGAGTGTPVEGFSGSSGPSTFDGIGSPGTGSPAQGAFGEPIEFGSPSSFGEPAGFGQPTSLDPYRPVGPPTSAAFGSFDSGIGQGSREHQLARLRQLLDKGILTESEYEAQRQQVINGS